MLTVDAMVRQASMLRRTAPSSASWLNQEPMINKEYDRWRVKIPTFGSLA